jgi:hypothetical protein
MGGGVVIETDHTPTSLTEKLPPPIIMTGFVLVDKSRCCGTGHGKKPKIVGVVFTACG